MKSYRILLTACLALLALPIQEITVQRNISYPELAQRSDRPNLYTERNLLPANDGQALLLVSFRIDYDMLPFRQQRESGSAAGEGSRFFAVAQANAELFESSTPIAREAWADTAWANSFEQTRSRSDHLEGAIGFALSPGEYRLRLDLNQAARPEQPRMPAQRRERADREPAERTIRVPDFNRLTDGRLLLLSESERSGGELQARVLNFGSSVRYGQDHDLLFLLPATPGDNRYELRVYNIRRGSEREPDGDPIHRAEFGERDLIHTSGFSFADGEKGPNITAALSVSESGYPLLLATLPNSRFPNNRLLIRLYRAGEEEPVVSQPVESRWSDMPVSLLNLDVAIDMLRFIVDDEALRRMRRGSAREREQRFRDFWSERDPSPDTEYNELMVEYYSRIDHTWDSYTTPERAGYDSDQGRAWILYGEPRRIERRYPPGASTQEIWTYTNRTLIFEATTGFGDFRLVREEQPR